MPELSRHNTTMLFAALAATLALAACGGDDDGDTTSATSATTPAATTTAPTSTEPGSTTTTTTPESSTQPKDETKVIPLEAPERSLSAAGLDVKIDVDHFVDPLRPDVDEPQPGNRLVGVYLKTRATGKYEPSKVTAIAGLTTQDGKLYPVRIIAGGNCEGAYFPGAFVLKSKKPRVGCVGFEIPQNAVPKEILLGVRSTTTGKGEQGKWELPSAS
jgi:hypothetical protein